jgi:hypothetical protein
MRGGFAKVYSGLGWLVLALGVLQFFLAGLGIFGASSFDAHEGVGYSMHGLTLLVFLAAVAGPRTGRDIGMGLVLLLIATLQVYLPELRGDVPELAALHPLVALVILGLASHIGSRYLGRGAAASAGPPATA